MVNWRSKKLSVLSVLLLVMQLISPAISAMAETNSSILPPSNLAAQMVTPDDVKLTWSAVYGATGYQVYEIKEGQLVLLGKTTVASYSLNNLAEGSYRYVVSTLSIEGESGPCAPVTVDVVYPDMAAPESLTQTIKNGNDIVLNWTASANTEKYNLYELSSNGEKTLLYSGTARTYTVSKATEGAHSYTVSAQHSLYGESPLSAPVKVEVMYPVMTAPANFTYTVANGNDVTFKWDAVPNATSYKLYQIVDGQPVLKNTVTTTTVKLTNVPAGDYVYEIRSSSDRFGESAEGTMLTVSVGAVTMAAPSNFTYKLQNTNDIVLTWGSVPYATAYKVYQIVDGQKLLKSTLTTATVTYAKMPAGDYVYEVYSYSDRFGESAEGSRVSLSVEGVAMETPGNVSYNIQNGNDIALSWTGVANATSYKVYQVSATGQKTLKSNVASTTVTYANQPEGDYKYEVHSYSTRFGESAEGSTLSLTLVHPVMQTPSNLKEMIKSDTSFMLSWDAVDYATSYKVYQVSGTGQKTLKSTVTATNATYSNMPSGDYMYIVHAYSSRFGESKEGTQVAFTLTGQSMKAPTNLTYTIVNGNDIKFSWTAAEYAASYKIYQVIDGQEILKNTVTTTSFTYTNLPTGDYKYVIRSVSTLFGESAEGAETSFSLVYPVMDAPGDFTYKIQNGNDVVLNWSAVDYANSYKVYEIVDGQKVVKYTGAALTTTLTNVPAGDRTYAIHSVSTRFGESAAGIQVSFTMNDYNLAAPENLTYSAANTNDITLKWNAVTNATSYKVYQIVDNQAVLKKTATTTSAAFTYLPEGDYQYEVHAYSDRFGESPEGSQVSFTIEFPAVPAAENFAYKVQNGNDIVFTWSAATYANSYKVYEIVDGQKVMKYTGTALMATLTNVPAGDHTYVVHSVSSRFGESAEGSQVSITMNEYNLAAPENLTYNAANINDITLKWTAVPNATGYKVYQMIDGELVLKKTVTTTSAVFTYLPEGEYQYEVRAYSTRFGDSPAASQVSFDIVFPVMQPPANQNYTVTNGNDVTLKWMAATYANSYKIYQIIDGERVLKNTVAGTSVTYTNMPEENYTYEVHSVSSRFGESPKGSDISFTLVFPVMQTPDNGSYTITNGNDITLKWAATTYATSYKVYQVKNSQKELVKTVTGTAVAFANMPEGDYTYEVHSVSSRFGESPEGGKIQFTLTWPVVQAPPLSGTVFNANNMTFTWKTVPWANEYRVYQITGDTRKLIYKGTALTYKTYNLTEDTHSFEVTAYSTRFGESVPSEQITEKIVYPVMQAPEATLTLTSETSARIVWDFVTYANGYNIYELIDGKPVLVAEKVNNLSYNVSNLSYMNHEYYVTSYSNSFGESDASNKLLAKLIVDTEAPVTKAEAPADWTNQKAVVTLSATDNETGVANTYYALDGGEFTAGTSLTIEEEGVHKVSFYSVDKVDNKETAQTIEVKVDKTAPVTKADATDTWSKDNLTVKLTASDEASGVAETFYSVNGSEYAEGTSVAVEKEGINTVSFYSVDKAGNKETVQTFEVKVDKTAPVTKADAPDTWSKDNVTVKLTASDEASGVAQTFYSVNGSEYAEGASVLVEKEGINSVSFYSMDAAGNKETVQTIEVKVDKTAPVTESDASDNWLQEDATVHLTATDKDSGATKTYYSINGSDYVEGTSFKVNKEGITTVSFYTVDLAGNVEEAKTIEVKVDKTAPVVSWNLSEEYALGTALNLTYKADDAASGIAVESLTLNGQTYKNGEAVTLSQPGAYKAVVTVTDKAGWTTTIEKTFVVYIPASIDVNPGVIKQNSGVITVQVTVPKGFNPAQFDLSSAKLSGVSANTGTNGLEQQAKKGQFKFNREDFTWAPGTAKAEFRGMLDGYLVVGSKNVEVK